MTGAAPGVGSEMTLGLRIALTHLTSRKRQTVMSLLGITLGVAFFMAVSSLMRGSEQDFIKRLIDSSPHITVSDEYRAPPPQPIAAAYEDGAVALHNLKPKTETRGIRGYKQKLELIGSLPGTRVAPVLTGQAIVAFAGKEQGVSMNGVIPSLMATVSDITEKIVAGSLETLAVDPNGIVVGRC